LGDDRPAATGGGDSESGGDHADPPSPTAPDVRSSADRRQSWPVWRNSMPVRPFPQRGRAPAGPVRGRPAAWVAEW